MSTRLFETREYLTLTCTRTTKCVTIISVIAVRHFVPSRKSVSAYVLGRESNAHVPIPTFGYYFHLVIIHATRGWNGVSGSYGRGIFGRFSITFIDDSEIVLKIWVKILERPSILRITDLGQLLVI